MSFLLLMTAFVLSGILHISNKALIEWGFAEYRDLYMLGFYGTPMLMGGIGMLLRRHRSTPADRWVGLMMGAAGALSMLFFLIALEHIPGIVAFPIRNLGNLVLTALVSIIAWRERLSRSQWLGVALSLTAIWLIY
jgi:multidrug transporter EmrE-like cation transporter